MLKIVNIVLFIAVTLGIYFTTEVEDKSEKQEVVEIYPGDTADEYEKIKELLGSEKASTEQNQGESACREDTPLTVQIL